MALVFAVASAGFPAVGQVPVWFGSRLDAVFADGPGVWIQSGFGLQLLAPSADGPSPSPPHSGMDVRELPADADLYDIRRGAVWVLARTWFGDPAARRPRSEPPLFPRPLPSPPWRLAMGWDGGGVEHRDTATDVVGTQGVVATMKGSVRGTLDVGWGLGDRFAADVVLPYALGVRGSDGTSGVLVGSEDRWRWFDPTGQFTELVPPPRDEEDGLLGFPFGVPPTVGPLGSAVGDAVILADASLGAVAIYEHLPVPAAPKVLLIDGLCFATFVLDGDEDGRTDLFVLRAQRPSLPAQLRILETGVIGVEGLWYQCSDAGLPQSPTGRVRFDLPLVIGLQNELRSADLPGYVVPAPGPSLLLAVPAGEVVQLFFDGREPRRRGKIPEGRALQPFTHLRCGEGTLIPWVTPTGASVYWIKDRG